jgi:hypothetical protein
MIASECGRQSEQSGDDGPQDQGVSHGERDLRECQRHAASGDGDDRRAEQAGAAVVGPDAGVDRHELCGVLGYVAHEQIDAVSAQIWERRATYR